MASTPALGEFGSRYSRECTNETWLWSRSPSIPCTQFEYCTRFDATMCDSGRSSHSSAGSGGGSSLGPM